MYFENTVGKEEIACNKQFLLFPQRFLHFMMTPFPTLFSAVLFSLSCISKGILCKQLTVSRKDTFALLKVFLSKFLGIKANNANSIADCTVCTVRS